MSKMSSRFLMGLAATSLIAVVAGCSSSSSGGGGTLTGTVESKTFSVASTLAISVAGSSSSSCTGSADGGATNCTSSSSGQGVVVLLTNRSSANCSTVLADLKSDTSLNYASFEFLELSIANEEGPLTAETYSVVPAVGATKGAQAQFETTTATCAEGVNATAATGSITLTTVSATEVEGTYDVSFGSNGSFSGTFSVPICDVPDGGFTSGSGTKPACEQ